MSAPAIPTGLMCTYKTSTLLTISWAAATDASGYTFTLNGSPAVPSNSTNSSATFTNLTAATAYAIIVTAVNSSGSAPSSTLNVTTSAANASFPSPSATTSSKASPTTIRYKKVVCWGLSPQAVNFAQATTLGHRVSIVLPVDVMNMFFTWTRASGEVAPTGRFNKNPVGSGGDFVSHLVKAFSTQYTDLDGVANGLNFSSSALDMAGDIKRDPCVYNFATDTGLNATTPVNATGISTTHYGANDLVMAYLMFKCFGSSSYDPTDIIYNVDDAYNMLSSQQLAEVINASLEAEDALANAAVLPNGKDWPDQLPGDNKGQVDAMFRGFLASDPLRYFLNGVQIPGLFETNFVCPPSDPAVHGNWCLTVGDKLEVPLQLVFRAPVTVMSVQDNIQNPSSATPDATTTTMIAGEAATFDCSAQKAALGNVIAIRLQITCGKPVAGGIGSGSTSDPGSIPLTVAAASSVVFYTNLNAGVQMANTMAVAGGVGALSFSLSAPLPANFPSGVTIDGNGILTYTPSSAGAAAGPWGKWALPVTVTDAATTPNSETRYINVSFDDGKGSSNNSIFIGAAVANAGVKTVSALPVKGVSSNPLYASVPPVSGTVQSGQTLVYASPPFASSAANSAAVASASNPDNLSKPLCVDTMTFTYTPPAVLSLSKTEPAVVAATTTWSIKSDSGKSGPGAVPNGLVFTPAASGGFTATLAIDLAAHDYSPGNAAGNVPGLYKFIVTSKDSNNYVQSFGVSINIAVPSPKPAATPLAASGSIAALSYVNGNTLTYASTDVDTIALENNTGQDGTKDHKWEAVPVGVALPAANLVLTPNATAGQLNKASLVVTAAGAPAGLYPYLIRSLDADNIVQTIFFTISMP